MIRLRALGLMFITALAFGQTPVTGPSWLEHLHRNMGESSMGRSSTQLGPPAEGVYPIQIVPLSPTVTLSGADLFRLKCQGCHGAQGQGSPPEINSIIDPVRATSATLVFDRMKQRGADISRKDAAALANQSETSLLDRLHKGGTNMPNPVLSEAELHVLLPYLRELAGLPAKQSSIRETQVRVGENLVKSTCHICHAATGPNPTPQQIGQGAIPPLSTLTSRVSLEQFIRKVTHGAPVSSGNLALVSRGRMPVFNYIQESEAEAAYIYLLTYPPQEQGMDLSPRASTAGKH